MTKIYSDIASQLEAGVPKEKLGEKLVNFTRIVDQLILACHNHISFSKGDGQGA